MKVLYITGSMPFGPGEAFFIPEVQEILRQGCELLIVPRFPSGDVVNGDAEGLEPRSLRKPLLSWEIVRGALSQAARRPLRLLRALGWLFASPNPRTFLKNLVVFPKALWIAGVAEGWGAEHIHAQWASTPATMALVASTLSGIPWSCTAHRFDILENNLLAAKVKRAAFFRFISQDGACMARACCGGALNGHAVVLHSCVAMPEKVEPHQAMSDPPVLLCAGALAERKGQRHLIEAVRMLGERGVPVRLWLAGEGPDRPMLESLVARYDLHERVTLLGEIDHAALLELFAGFYVDVVVLPSLHEGVPAGLIEPMGYAIPVISTNVGGIPELLADGAGVMVPPQDAAALAEAIQHVVTDTPFRMRLAAAGRRRVVEGWATPTVVTELLSRIAAAGARKSEETAS